MSKPAEDRMVVVAKIINTYEAHIGRAVLESVGIQSRLDGEHHIAMDWLISHAVGGVKLLVHQRDAEVARKLLDQAQCQIRDEQTGDHSKPAKVEVEGCPVCHSKECHLDRLSLAMMFLTILLVGFPLLFISRKLVCNRCSHRWDRPT